MMCVADVDTISQLDFRWVRGSLESASMESIQWRRA